MSPSTTTIEPTASTSTSTEPPTLGEFRHGGEGVGDPYFPTLGNGGYDIGHYSLSLVLTDVPGSMRVKTTISATALEGLDQFNVDYSGPPMESATVAGEAATVQQERDQLLVTPAVPISPGDFEMTFVYEGTPSSDFVDVGIPIEVGWTTQGEYLLAVGQPYGSSLWFPGSDHPSDKATYDFAVSVPRGLTAVANGELTKVQSEDHSTTYQWEMDVPMATNVVSLAVGRFDLEASVSPNGTRLLDAVPSGGDARPGAIETTAAMLDAFEARFGPYPFESYGSLVLPTPLGYALEQQGRSLFGSDLIRSESVIAHELGHQWFGDHISPQTWQDVWLNEGFATFTQWWWDESRGIGSRRNEANQVLAGIRQGDRSLTPPSANPGPEFFGRSVYSRGAAGLVALELHLGDQRFDELLTRWIETHGGKSASTGDFLSLVQAVGGDDALEMLVPWVLGGPIADLPTR